jgi:ribonuclease HII
MVKVAGVDEAGRGPAIGPLVVGGVLFDEETAEALPSIGVKDSKKLSPKRRESLEVEIMDLADSWAFFDLQPRTIDKVVNRGVVYRKLNYLEAMAMAKVIRDLAPHRAIVDPADTVIDRFVGDIKRVIPPGIEVYGESHADDIYPVVSAASILAKVRRDRFVAELREEHGDFGSGYSSDRKTVSFLESWFEDRDDCPPFMRCSWATIKRLRAAQAR